MSLAKRFFDGFLGKKDKNAEKPGAPPDTPPAADERPEPAAPAGPAGDSTAARLTPCFWQAARMTDTLW